MCELIHSSVCCQADVSHTDAIGRTPLYCAALEGEAAPEWLSQEHKDGITVVVTFVHAAPSQDKPLRFARYFDTMQMSGPVLSRVARPWKWFAMSSDRLQILLRPR